MITQCRTSRRSWSLFPISTAEFYISTLLVKLVGWQLFALTHPGPTEPERRPSAVAVIWFVHSSRCPHVSHRHTHSWLNRRLIITTHSLRRLSQTSSWTIRASVTLFPVSNEGISLLHFSDSVSCFQCQGVKSLKIFKFAFTSRFEHILHVTLILSCLFVRSWAALWVRAVRHKEKWVISFLFAFLCVLCVFMGVACQPTHG